jgi:hypothetical protein
MNYYTCKFYVAVSNLCNRSQNIALTTSLLNFKSLTRTYYSVFDLIFKGAFCAKETL